MKLFRFIQLAIVAAMAQFDLKNATIRLEDGSGTPNKLDIKVGDGTLSFDETKNRRYVLDRGRLSTVTNGDQVPMDVRFDIIWEFLRASTTASITPEDALKQRYGASSWVSSDSDLCAPYAVDICVFYDPQCSVNKIEKIILPDFRYEKLTHDAKAGMMQCSGKCNATEATVVRLAQT